MNNAVTCSDTTTDSTTTPFCTITAAEKKTVPGDTVSVAAGTYNESVTADVAGVTFKATGAAVVEGKTPTAFNNGFVIRAVDGVTIDGFTIQNQAVHGIIIDASSAGTPATNITVKNVTVQNAGNHGINVQNSNHVLITGTTVKNSGRIGIRLAGTSDSTVSHGLSTGNVLHGISVQSTTAGVSKNDTVTDMVSSFNKNPAQRESVGINVSEGSANTVVERNTTYSNDDSGIQVYSGATGTVVRRNVSYDNGDHGVDMNAVPGTTVVSNTSVGNYAVGINAENSSTGVTIRDNISVDDGANSDRTKGNYRVEAGSESGTTMDRDLAYQSSSSTNLWYWGGTGYSSLAAFQSATGQEAHGFQTDPKFVSLGGRDLRLAAGSPVIDAAFSDVPGWTNNDRNGNAPVDDPAVTNTGTGPVTYADLGAIERTDVGPAPTDNPPVARLTASPTTLVAGGTTTLDASGSTDDKGIVSYTFDCKNGTTPITGTTKTATCTYATAGTYKPTVTVKDTAGQTSTADGVTITVTAPADQPPVAKLTASPTSLVEGGTTTLDASGSTDDKGIVSYTFDCKNGTTPITGTTKTATCTYATAGTYKPTVTVKDTAGQTSTADGVTITVTKAPPPADNPPVAKLTASPTTLVAGGTTTLDASGSTDDKGIVSYTFDCKNGTTPTTGTTKTATCTYATAGTYKPTVTVKDTAGQTGTADVTITVNPAPPAPTAPTAALAVSSTTLRQGQHLAVDAGASHGNGGATIVSYAFKCGRQPWQAAQATATGECTFMRVGDKTVRVRVTDSNGLTAVAATVVTVRRGVPPTARLTVSDSTPYRGQRITLDASASTGTALLPIQAYRFKCGHQATTAWRTSPMKACTFRSLGWHRVKVWVKSAPGLWDVKVKRVYVHRR